MPSLRSSPVSGSQPGCEAREFTLYTNLRHTGGALIITTRLCFSTEASINCHLGMPHRQFTPCVWYPSIYNPWARTSQRRALSKRINSPPPNRYIFNRDQSHGLKSNVRHTVHLQVRSGSERNRRHLVPRISIDLQVRLDDHQLFPSSWVYSPIKIISNHPNDVKTSGLRPSSSSSTYRRISYSEWDKPGLSE